MLCGVALDVLFRPMPDSVRESIIRDHWGDMRCPGYHPSVADDPEVFRVAGKIEALVDRNGKLSYWDDDAQLWVDAGECLPVDRSARVVPELWSERAMDEAAERLKQDRATEAMRQRILEHLELLDGERLPESE